MAAGLMERFYAAVVTTVVPVSSNATAEAVKLTENIFRAVNIALVNELKVVYEAMGIDVWEVIDAAKTKPFGYMPFYPGPGLGGHCIPIDPFYLTWKSREYELPTRFIELAGEINSAMPVTSWQGSPGARPAGGQGAQPLGGPRHRPRLQEECSGHSRKPLPEADRTHRGARRQGRLLRPHVEEIPSTREHMALKGRRSVVFDEATVRGFDAVLIATDHDAVDYAALADWSPLIVDTRNVFARLGLAAEHIVKA